MCAMCGLMTTGAGAFDASHFATQSKLATGKWVKITIPETGIYELTYDELQEMGFAQPENVRVYGQGGNMMDELLSGQNDDLSAVPVTHINNKIVFYGVGPVNFTLSDPLNNPYYTRTMNAYSLNGYYFLTEASDTPLLVNTAAPSATVSETPITSSYDYFWHEQELSSTGFTGKQLLGEDITNGYAFFDYLLPNMSDNVMSVLVAAGAKVTSTCYVEAYVNAGGNRTDVGFSLSTSKVKPPASSFVYYNEVSPHNGVTLPDINPQGQLEIGFWSPGGTGKVSMGKLDYFIITYKHDNIIADGCDNQVRMGFAQPSETDRIVMPQAPQGVMVWNISKPQAPVSQQITVDEQGDAWFAPGISARQTQYVAFNPNETLKKIAAYQEIENQNLHAMNVPDLLIVTTSELKEQAQRLAQLHEQVDGIDVAVVDQEQVFNEFSSGAMDAMAVRLLCKMLYDRNSNKFKNLLMFGPGTFDNRGCLGGNKNFLVNYETDVSNDEDLSFTCDDFFGILADNAPANIASGKLSIGVGRITCKDADEAKTDVDKLVKYIADPDYGTWRNNMMIICDQYDGGLHLFQAEGVNAEVSQDLNTQMHINKVYCPLFPRAADETTTETDPDKDRRTAKEAKRYWELKSKQGQYFATFIGHAGHAGFTKVAHMWTMNDVQNTSYEHMPIWMTACCDVARYDGANRGVAEVMFHKPDGGGIALLTSARQAYASDNDELNRAFIEALFSYRNMGKMPTLGEAYMKSKLHFSGLNYNKMSFFLLGDPAIQINYPKPYFQITEVNGTSVEENTVDIYPMQEITVKARVTTANGQSLDETFTGDAYLTLYDYEAYFGKAQNTVSSIEEYRDVYYDRDLLAEVKGRVENGIFEGKLIVPRNTKANGQSGMLRVYAHKDNSHDMVNGQSDKVIIQAYDPEQAVADEQAPVIETMFINDEESFDKGELVAPSSTLYIHATDDCAFNTQAKSLGTVSLALDGGADTYMNITNYITCADDGKQLDVAFPLTNLSEGLHSLTFTAYDVVGNKASRTISFVVGQPNEGTIRANDLMAVIGSEVTFDVNDINTNQPVTIKVTDNKGSLVWSTTTSSFPVNWDLVDLEGNVIKPGAYRYFGSFNDGTSWGGTNLERLIVLDTVKSNQ